MVSLQSFKAESVGSYSIKELEHLSNIKAHTLRIWEQRYGFIKPSRTEGNVRTYSSSDLKLILNIALLKENGHKISKIAQMSDQEIHRSVIDVSKNLHKTDDQIQAMVLAMLDTDEDRFEKVLSRNILKSGFEQTIVNIIYPFLARIGIMWQTGSINPAKEHFITNLIRQKIIVAIDGQYVDQVENPLKYLLFLPDGELHEVSLLFCNYIVRSRGFKSIYLGQSLPHEDLKKIYNFHSPQFIMTVLTTYPGMEKIQEYVTKLENDFPNSHLLLSGGQVVGQDLEIGEKTTIFNKIEDMITTIDEIKKEQHTFV